MSWVLGIILFSGPIFTWGDSLYLDLPRLGKVADFSSNGRSYHWVYNDVVIYELNSEWRWCIGIKQIQPDMQSKIAEITDSLYVDSVESAELEELTRYWIDEHFFETRYYQGPWKSIDNLLSRLTPSYTFDVRDEPMGTGMVAVHGMLCGEGMSFRSVSGTYETQTPSLSADVTEYLETLAQKRSVLMDDLDVDGILCIKDNVPMLFYVLEGS
ncbi:hypothetical protein JXM67_13450 [candidate division WOR-3 bacterium]|nr:hypothetical protein [candidate division WOR-3 bacterium]